MGHGEGLRLLASPLNEGGYAPHGHGHTHGGNGTPVSHDSHDIEHQKTSNTTNVPFNTNDESLHDNPAFHRHAEATTAELFYEYVHHISQAVYWLLNESLALLFRKARVESSYCLPIHDSQQPYLSLMQS